MFLAIVLLVAAAAAKPVIHLVSHTHDDTGWLKTVDQYHYGSNNSIQFAGTQYILDSVVANLKKDPKRRFVYVEQAFFWRWWEEQTDDVKEDARKLVRSGQLQFANGGWCMHDEAATYYIDMIDQTTLGHRFLKNELNAVPLIGWQIDPFGHSSTQASLISFGSGFLATYFGRADYQEYSYREANKAREFWWSASRSVDYATLLGGILLTNHYGPPAHFHWDVISPDKTPIETDRRLHGYNVQERVDIFVAQALNDANKTLGNNIMWTMGDDFNYQDANMWFKNIDKLIAAVNADGRVEARYSTPLEYTLEKLGEGLNFPNKTDDFFPYEDNPHAFWSGYFTSRAAFKRFVRDMSGFHTMTRQIFALSGVPNVETLPAMGQAMGLSQHHDAVTGTSKQHVVFDYAERVTHARNELDLLFAKGFNATGEVFCHLANESVCEPAAKALSNEGGFIFVIVWNQLARPASRVIRIPVPVSDVEVESSDAADFQVYDSPQAVDNYHRSNPRSLPYTVSFHINLPALGPRVVKLKRSPTAATYRRSWIPTSALSRVSNGLIEIRFDANGRMSSVHDVLSGTTVAARQDWCYYESNTGDSASWQPSGAYIFRPKANTTCVSIAPEGTEIVSKVIASGESEKIIEQQFSSWLTQRIRLPRGGRFFEIEFTITGIPIGDNIGKEIVSKFETNISSQKTIYTDSNGREMQKRVLNERTFPFVQTEPIAGNYYPVNALAFINDTSAQFSVLVDASNGGASLRDGEIELMVFRRILVDDGRGVGEPLNETEWITGYYQCGSSCGQHYGPPLIVRGVHTFTVLPSTEGTAMTVNRMLMDEVYAAPRPMFVGGANITSGFSYLSEPLPTNLQLTTLELLNSTTLLLRISHQFAVNEDPINSKPVIVDLKNLFSHASFSLNSFEEYSLSANQKRSEMLVPFPSSVVGHWKVQIKPMEVRTYLFDVTLSPSFRFW